MKPERKTQLIVGLVGATNAVKDCTQALKSFISFKPATTKEEQKELRDDPEFQLLIEKFEEATEVLKEYL